MRQKVRAGTGPRQEQSVTHLHQTAKTNKNCRLRGTSHKGVSLITVQKRMQKSRPKAAFLLGEDKVFIVSFACNPNNASGVSHFRINYSIDTSAEVIHIFFILIILFSMNICYA